MGIVFLSFIFCLCGSVTAYQEVDKIEVTTLKSANMSINESQVDSNVSSHWVPPQSFASGALSAFTVIAVSELGDKTFFIAVVLALTHSPICVFAGAISALTLMTLLSAGLGLVGGIIPDIWVQCLSAALFFIFGLKMLREGYIMHNSSAKEEFENIQKTMDSKMGKNQDVEAGIFRRVIRWVFIEAFAMTFLAEWGDRSQITTFVLAAKDNVYGVVVGATLGHAACTLLAVIGGRIVADRISLKIVTIFGGLLFLVFAIISLVNGVQEYLQTPAS